MTNYAPTKPGVASANRAMHAAAAADSFDNDGRVLLYVENNDAAPTTLTIDDPNSPIPEASAANNDAVVVIAAGAKKFLGPFKPSRFNDVNGRVQLAWSNLTAVTWTAVTTS